MEFLVATWVWLWSLREPKLKRNFQDTINTICSWSLEAESTFHYFLHSRNLTDLVSWKNSLKLIHVFWHYIKNLPRNSLDDRYDNKTNTSTTLVSIKFTYASKSFNGQLMWYKIINKCLSCLDFSLCLISTSQITMSCFSVQMY